MDQDIRANNKKDNNSTTNEIPWYFRRWFWGAILGVSILPSIPFYLMDLPKGIFNKITGYFMILPVGLDIIFNKLFLNGIGKIFILIYYVLLGILIYLSFKNKKTNITSIIITIIIIFISTLGLIIARALSI